jgi:hypothetical protein
VVSIIAHTATFKAGGDIQSMCAPSYAFRNTGEEVEKNYLHNKSFKYEEMLLNLLANDFAPFRFQTAQYFLTVHNLFSPSST